MRKDSVIRATEHLKKHITDTVFAFKEGVVPSAAEAALKIFVEVQATLQDIKPSAFQDVLDVRVEVDHGKNDMEARKIVSIASSHGADVVSLRYLGPPTLVAPVDPEEPAVDLPGVLYFVARVPSRMVGSLLQQVRTIGEIKRWSYGCVRRSAV